MLPGNKALVYGSCLAHRLSLSSQKDNLLGPFEAFAVK